MQSLQEKTCSSLVPMSLMPSPKHLHPNKDSIYTPTGPSWNGGLIMRALTCYHPTSSFLSYQQCKDTQSPPSMGKTCWCFSPGHRTHTNYSRAMPLLWCQVDDFAIAVPDIHTTNILLNKINDYLFTPVKSQGYLNMYIGIDITQTRYYIIISCTIQATEGVRAYPWIWTKYVSIRVSVTWK